MLRGNDEKGRFYEKYIGRTVAQGDIEGITRYDTFTSALKFGILLMIEIFMGQQETEGGVQAE